MAIGITAGLGALSAKLLALLKAGKISASAAKAALAAQKAKTAGTVLGTTGSVLHKAVPFTRGTAGTRMANPGFVKKVLNRAGYEKGELAINLIPDVIGNVLYAGMVPGDLGDKAIAMGSNILLGQGLAVGGRAAMNAGRARRQLTKINNEVNEAARLGNRVDPRKLTLRDRLQAQQNVPQALEVGSMMAGGYAAYPVGEEIQRMKSYIGGQGYLSPTDRMFAEQDAAMQEQMLAAYQAGAAAGAQGGYYYDPYTGDVPLGGYGGY